LPRGDEFINRSRRFNPRRPTLWPLKGGQELEFVFRHRDPPVGAAGAAVVWRYEPADGAVVRELASRRPGPRRVLAQGGREEGRRPGAARVPEMIR
jgi:hypothetical protein